METIVQWTTILSPIIAVILAWWTGRSSAKAAEKQISATLDVALLQIETTLVQMEPEFFHIEQNMKVNLDEIEELKQELQRLTLNKNVSEFERQEFIKKIQKRTDDKDWQYSWWRRLFLIQANLTFIKERINDRRA